MEHTSPSTYGPPNWATGYQNTNKKSPLTSPQANRFQESPDFSPYSSSSPIKIYHSRNNRGTNRRRYFNTSTGHYSNNGNFSSPNKHVHNWRNRGNYHRPNSDLNDSTNISNYFHPSMLEDPWEELEQKLKKEPIESNEKTNNSPEDLNNDTSVQN